MFKRRLLPSCKILSCLSMSSAVVAGYIPSDFVWKQGQDGAPYRKPDLRSSGLQKSSDRRVSYDLGLGKNPPVIKKGSNVPKNNYQPPSNPYEACRYLLEHKSTRTFPSPSVSDVAEPNCDKATNDVSKEQSVCDSKQSQRSKQNLVVPRRTLEDVLFIVDTPGEMELVKNLDFPTMTSAPDAVQLDLNSVWVEMLIYSQQVNVVTL